MTGSAIDATVVIEQVRTPLTLTPGVREYRCFAPVLWPDGPLLEAAPVTLEVGGRTVAEAVTSVGNHRPWTFYVLSDVCTDYAWVYSDEREFRSHDAAVTEAELTVAEAQTDVAAGRSQPLQPRPRARGGILSGRVAGSGGAPV